MEGRGRSRARKKHRIIVPKRLVAFMMTALMVFTTIGPDLSVAFAASEADVVFELDGADLVQSVEDAVAEGNEVTKEDVNFTDGDVDRYEELFFGEGKLYEAYPELNAGGSDADLRVFVRLPEDADESYIVTGDEELLFLFINNSDEAMTCRADITRVVNGKERTKKTRTMLVKSYMNVFDYIFGDAEVPEEIEDAVENGTLATDSDASNNNEEVPTATDSDAAVTLSLKDVPRVTAPADAVATDSDASKDETDTEDQTPADDETNADANGPAADDADEEKETSGEKPAVSAGDLVGIDWCSTARVYTTTLNKLGLMGTATEISAEVQGADGVTVTLSAREGVLPEGSYVEAVAIDDASTLEEMMAAANSELNPEDKIAVDIFAADVVLYDADGNEIQPDGSVRVTFEGTGLDADASTVFHMEDRGGVSLMRARNAAQDASAYNAKEMTSANADGDAVAFMTTHFSVYSIVTTEDVTFHLVNFYYTDAQGTVNSISEGQWVQDGDAAIEPAVPDRDGYVFIGWSDPSVFVSVNEPKEVYAQYAESKTVTLTVNYQYADNSVAMKPWTASVLASDTEEIVVPSPEISGYTADRSSVTFKGPYTDANVTETVTYTGAEVQYTVKHILRGIEGTDIKDTVAATDTLYGNVGALTNATAKEYEGFVAQEIPRVSIESSGTVVEIYYERVSYTLAYDTEEGATYIPTVKYPYGAPIDTPDNPVRLGYTFSGWSWYYMDNETEESNGMPQTMPAGDVMVKANWTPNTRAEYQVVYWLESLVDGVGYDYITTKSADGIVGQIIPSAASLTSREWDAANIDSAGVEWDHEDQNVTITADGKAVKNVYYDRKEFSVSFYLRSWGQWREQNNLKITAKYGEDVSDKWTDSAHSQYMWYTSTSLETSVGAMSAMPAKNLNRYGNQVTTRTIYYMVEKVNSSEYEQYTTGVLPYGWTINNGDVIEIPGFTYSRMSTWNRTLYYTRNSYTISFENCSGVRDDTLEYEERLSNARPTGNIGRPAGVDSDYIFGGWYTSSACEDGTEVNWNSTMPSRNLQVFAKWIAPTYKITFESNGGTEFEPREYEKYAKIENLPTPEKANDEFLGWYVDDKFVNEFVEGTNIVENITLYAKWESSNTVDYTVKHVNRVNDQVLDTEKQTGTLNTTVTISAKSIPGYYAEISESTVLLKEAEQEFVIHYVPITEWSYTVKYVDSDGNAIDGYPPVKIEGQTADRVVVSYEPIDGYTLISKPNVTLQRNDSGEAEVVFKYKKNTTLYHVQHILRDQNGNEKVYQLDTVKDQPVGATVPEIPITPLEIQGYTYNATDSVTSGTTSASTILILKLYYDIDEMDLEVNYVDEEGSPIKEPYFDTVYYNSSYDLSEKKELSINHNGKNYVLDRMSGSPISGTVTGNVEVNFIYSLDDNNNGTPDKYEVTITYLVVNGYFNDTETLTEVKKDYVLAEKQTDGTWNETTKYLVEIPKPTAKTGYNTTGTWEPETPTDRTEVTKDETYVFTYGAEARTLKVKYVRDTDLNTEIKTAHTENTEYNATYDLTAYKDASIEYEGKNYVLDSMSGSPISGTVTDNVEVVLVYSLDEIGEEGGSDTIPDKYQVSIVFAASFGNFDNGSTQTQIIRTLRDENKEVSVDGTYKLKAEDIPNVRAIPGYDQDSKTWDKEPVDAVISKAGGVFYVTFGPAMQSYIVQYIDEDTKEGLQDQQTKDAKYGTYIKGSEEAIEIEGYTFTNATDLIVSEHNEINYVFVYYSKDENNDEIPDKYQVEVVFAAVNGTFDENGTTQLEKIVTLKDPVTEEPSEDGTYTFPKDLVPTATPATGYVQPGVWDKDPAVTAITKDENHTFVITFGDKDTYKVFIEYYFDGEQAEDMTKEVDAEFETIYNLPSVDKAIVREGVTYAYDRTENDGLLVSSDSTKNVVKVYYALDEKGGKPGTEEPDEPGKPDEIPDKYQLVFRYRTDGNGTVTGTTYETHTFTDDDGNYTEISATSPKVAVTVSGNTSRYVFDYWTDDDGNRYETDADLKAATFTEDMTFTAHFDYTGGGSSSGGGGGGGGGTSSGSDPNNGPGVVNIEDGDVPLAPLPGDNGLYVIEDGDVPLAPLPKTGQKPMAATVGMLFSGILLALSTLRKRKEEN